MLSSDPAKLQARILLQTLCQFILPLIQVAALQTTIDAKQFVLGFEADELVTELEKFISGVISHSQPTSQDIKIEVGLGKDSFEYLEGTLWEMLAPDDEAIDEEYPNDTGTQDNRSTDQSPISDAIQKAMTSPIIEQPAVPLPIPPSPNDKVFEDTLQGLRRYITQAMPIRLLFFKARDSKLEISLMERADIYSYLAPKLRADFYEGRSMRRWISNHAEYAILSHTWSQMPGELTYGDWQKGSLDATQPKCRKLLNFCKVAWEDHSLRFGWIDTVCINKESSAELDESIRSMYAWYCNAKVCITYLAGTEILSDMHDDPWFNRGWTFQELVAPQHLKFYNMHWNKLSDEESSNTDKEHPLILKEINLATTITAHELLHIRSASISRRMQLAAKRQVTRKEDIAYCLMGIFDVSISTAYGEGPERAFFRLVNEIFNSVKNVSDIFNWAGDHDPFSWRPTTCLFPSRPSDYLHRSSNNQLCTWHPIEPLTLTHLGLRTPILLMPAVSTREWILDPQPIGDYHAAASIAPSSFEIPKNYYLLDKRMAEPSGLYDIELVGMRQKITLTFGTLNVEEQGTNIHVPKDCFAILLKQPLERKGEASSAGYEKVYTRIPIVFDLKNLKTPNTSSDHGRKPYYEIKRSQLAKHGMELVTLYL